ncbi:winged helix-turn-helix transcriptional regulator [Amycolatopsis nigrescens]|uniref:winged helix-turn-helix transcriptional regulator n=1 Tax=Amycolatopsis nigrescens TaxID=381445 RepID=UPI000375D0DC|nr:helix-turn-helix domain-containing protein [Amycolatopsis nigrescens]
MKRTPFADWPCSIARTVDLLGDWWTPLVLREAYYGVRRFDEFQRVLRIGRNVLTQRLARLTDEGLFERVAYQDKPARYEYVLTEKGRDVFPVLLAMTRWGDRWLAPEAGPPVLLRHTACGHETHAEMVCAHCGEQLAMDEVVPRFGPGYPARLRERPEIRARFDKRTDEGSESGRSIAP